MLIVSPAEQMRDLGVTISGNGGDGGDHGIQRRRRQHHRLKFAAAASTTQVKVCAGAPRFYDLFSFTLGATFDTIFWKKIGRTVPEFSNIT